MKSSYAPPRAHYSVQRFDHVLVVIDEGVGARSVTNDAEYVCRELHETMGPFTPDTRVIYRDTMGRYDELVVDTDGRFLAFRSIGKHVLHAALAAVAQQGSRR